MTTNVIALYVASGTGSLEFRREALKFGRIYGVTPIPFFPYEHAQVEKALADHTGFQADLIAIFCHGFRTRLQTGHSIGWRPSHKRVRDLAGSISLCAKPDAKVILYACSTGGAPTTPGKLDDVGGEGGFADTLRDELGKVGMSGGWVDAHAMAGHTTRLPLVRRFYTDGDPQPSPGVGGDWIVAPRTPSYRRWHAYLETDGRFRFPLMSIDAIRADLASESKHSLGSGGA